MHDHYDVILTALHERRNRLIQLDINERVNKPSVPKLRARINECTEAINALTAVKRSLNA